MFNEVRRMNRKQHLIALDLDGTLLTDKKEISPHTLQVVKQAKTDGHIVVIATGRPSRASIHYYHMLGLTTPMINYNGALTYHPKNEKWGTFHHPMPLDTTLSVIDTCFELGVNNILAEVKDHAYLNKYDQEIIDVFKTVTDENSDEPYTIGGINKTLTEDPTALMIMPKKEQIDILSEYLEENHGEIIEYRNWGAPWSIFEINKKGIHKAFGLKKVADYYQIPQERIIAFGDEDNDIEMIDYAGIGVAMQNAIPELQAIADVITNSNEEDGVGSFLEDYLNIQLPII